MKRLMSRLAVHLLAAVLVFGAAPVLAQEHRAAIRGTIVDPALAPLADVEITITSEATNQVRRTRSDERGRFGVPELPPGIYRIDVRHPRYGPYVARVSLAINQEFWLHVPLQLGELVQAVDVTAPYLPIDRDSPALHTFIDTRQLIGLPLDGRNFLELALLAPGTAPAPEGSASSLRGDFALSINGGREDFNGFLLDGVYNIDPKLNTPGVRPPVDAIREFQVLTSTYDASFGRNGGGQINVITKSGANRASGSGYEFFRNTALSGRNYFAPEDEPTPEYNRNQFGGTIGGPIARDRTFFFADYERTRLREGITRVTNVPTLAERAGDFSGTLFRQPFDPFTGPAVSGRPDSVLLSESDRSGDRRALSGAQPVHAARQLRVVADASGRHPRVRRARRSHAVEPCAALGPLQLQRSAARRTVRGRGLRRHSGIRHRPCRAGRRTSRSR